MLLKASKSILSLFKQHFCENPSKLVNLADFASQKKGRHFTTYFSKGNFRKKKKGLILVTVTLTKWTFFAIGPILMIFMGGRVNTCYFLDFAKFLQKKGKKGYYGHFGTLLDLDINPVRYQNNHSTPFYPFFQKCFEIYKVTCIYSATHKYHWNRSNRKKGPFGQSGAYPKSDLFFFFENFLYWNMW